MTKCCKKSCKDDIAHLWLLFWHDAILLNCNIMFPILVVMNNTLNSFSSHTKFTKVKIRGGVHVKFGFRIVSESIWYLVYPCT